MTLDAAVDSDVTETETLITLDMERYVVIRSNPGGPFESATVSRRDGTYINKLTVGRVTEREAGQYVCSSSNSAGYVYRHAYLSLLTRRHKNIFLIR